MRTGRIILVMVGALLTLTGLLAAAAGTTMLVAYATQRDGAGFYSTPTERFDTSTVALLGNGEFGSPNLVETVRVRGTSDGGGALFIGIGPRDEVEAWLSGTAHERVVSLRYWPFEADTELADGGLEPAGLPAEQDFWAASVAGPGTQTLTWPAEEGRWSLVVMNTDGTPGVAADLAGGIETDLVLPGGIVSAVVGGVLLAGGVVLMLLAVRGGRLGAVAAPPASNPEAYPVRLDARLDVSLSRWHWLVKWFLAIPHVFLLSLLWLAFAPLTIVAGVAILFTGRYPKAIFEFNVGVLRWTWRVAYYAFGALGTDRYPPFSLDSDPSYPADLAVDYPARLSRGLVLVKWWLLAIPHYLVVALFSGGWSGWFGWSAEGWQITIGGGLISILVLVAVVMLLFTGRYPQPVFDFVMGMNRWSYRVLAYAALMRDEYPPFRLDNGGTDPGSQLAPVPTPPLEPAGLSR